MNNYIKFLVEAFDFNSVKKQNKSINAVDTVLKYIIPKIDNREKLSQDDYDNILKNSVGIYKVSERAPKGQSQNNWSKIKQYWVIYNP